MKKLFRYFKGYIPQTVLAPFFKLCEVVLELLVPMIMAQIINVGIRDESVGYILSMCGVLVLLGAVGLGFALTAQYFAAKSAVGFTARVRSAMFSKVNSLSFSQLDQIGGSTVITRMTADANQLQNGVNMTLRLALRSPFVILGAMLMAFLIDRRAALVFLITTLVLFAVIFLILLVCLPLYKKVQGNLDSVMKRTRENLSGVRVIRAFCLEDSEKEKFDNENSLLYRSQIFVGRLSALLNPLTYVLINAAILLLVFTGAKGGLLQGSVVALYNYMSLILVELIKLANIIITINKSLACARRISEFLEIQPDLHPERPDSAGSDEAESDDAPAVQFEGVSLSYNGGKEALEDISFSVARGETLGIIGGTGSGKSSVAMMIPRFYDASAGRVLLHGKDVKTFEIDQLRSRVGIVLQTAALFSGTVRDNIRWGNPDATDEEIVEALKAAQAYEFISKLPDGIDSKVSQNGKNFSGGQRQRLSIARALVRKPEILILDDSSSALDYATDLELRRALAALVWNPTVIIISQRTVSVMSADHILVLDDGKQVGFGTHEQLLESCEVYREIYSCAGSHKADK